MAKAKRVKQLSFMMPNRAGLLSEISAAVSAAKVIDHLFCSMDRWHDCGTSQDSMFDHIQ